MTISYKGYMLSPLLLKEYKIFRDHVQQLGFLNLDSVVQSSIDIPKQSNGIVHLGMFRKGTGITTYAEAIINGLRNLGRPTIVTGIGQSEQPIFLSLDKVFGIEDVEKSWSQLIDKIIGIIEQTESTNLICHREFPFGLIGAYIKQRYGLNVSVIMYGHQTSMELLKSPAGHLIVDHLNTVNRIISLSDFIKKEAISTGVLEDKIITIRGGYDPDIFSPQIDKKQSSIESFRVGFVGRFDSDKDPLTFINAIQKVVIAGIKIDAFMLGTGQLFDKIRIAIREGGLESVIKLKGNVSSREVGQYLQSLDLLVVPSRFEGLGIQTVEALASGVPVIASRVGGLVELIKESGGGVLVDQGNSEAFADQIIQLATNIELRKALQRQALSFSSSASLTWQNVVQAWNGFIDDHLS